MKKRTAFAGIIILTALILLIWITLRTPEIKAVHRESYFTSVLIENPPLTARGALTWWRENQAMLKAQYHIPQEDCDQVFYLSLWDFADGYKEEEDKDRLCFDDMPAPRNCIDKKWVMTVSRARNGKRIYVQAGTRTWVQSDGGEYISVADDE
ncbi:DUF943 family protein [Siccibacter colletis]|uniref:DUF943 family protein n=1 Tax=Siccibacter colletis TaxID=1505757 RepID=A0ABY6JBD2_9ENTR|nr:DUF943 family protein [Siccibacter colletis]UYU31145.1 DUF943 family protein [Siccibacter colletis]